MVVGLYTWSITESIVMGMTVRFQTSTHKKPMEAHGIRDFKLWQFIICGIPVGDKISSFWEIWLWYDMDNLWFVVCRMTYSTPTFACLATLDLVFLGNMNADVCVWFTN